VAVSVISPRRAKQPQHAPVIDWGNPITRGLQVAWVASHPGRAFGPANVTVSTNTTTPSAISGGRAGQAAGSTGYLAFSANNVFQANTWTGVVFGHTFGNSVSTVSLFTAANAPGGSTADRSIYVTNSGGNRVLAAYLFDGGVNTVAGTAAVDFDRPHLFAGASDGSSVAAWTDGQLAASQSAANGGYTGYGASGPQMIVGYGCPGLGQYTASSDVRASLFLWWTRALSASEHRALADNPYQVFAPAPAPRRLAVMAVAAPPPSSARPQVFVCT
jgi:hypothetical protein